VPHCMGTCIRSLSMGLFRLWSPRSSKAFPQLLTLHLYEAQQKQEAWNPSPKAQQEMPAVQITRLIYFYCQD